MPLRDRRIAPLSAVDAGQATIVRAKAMGHAMMNCLGHPVSHSVDGPVKMGPTIPDIVAG